MNQFLSRENLNLVVFGNELEPRKVNDEGKCHNSKPEDEVVYADASAMMILSEESIKDLNEKLSNQVTVKNFRPNLLVETSNSYEEDNWENFKIKDSKFRKLKHCTR